MLSKLKLGLSQSIIQLGKGLTEIEQLVSGLTKISIIDPSKEELVSYSDLSPWRRGGVETYIADSVITISHGNENQIRHFIAKALISTASKPSDRVYDWLSRRNDLIQLGIKTPYLYSHLNGTIYEEFIDTQINHTHLQQIPIIIELARIAAILDMEGYPTLNFINDLRIKSETIYYIDFGFDLGTSHTNSCNNAKITLLKTLPIELRALATTAYLAYTK